jgi:hypothetical protein
VKPAEINARFVAYRDALGLPKELSPHSARHAYVTHLTEDGVDRRFIQEAVGHRRDTSTAIYTHVSGDFMNTALMAARSGKIPTTSVRLRISLFNRSWGLLLQICFQTDLGKAAKARMSSVLGRPGGAERGRLRLRAARRWCAPAWTPTAVPTSGRG